jgi:hypothetical protein
MSDEDLPTPADVLTVVDRIKPLLAGLGPLLQGAVLCELTSLWVAGHEPSMREIVLRLHIRTVRKLTKVNAREVWKDQQ